MNEYRIEDSTLYNQSTVIAGIPVYIFEEHQMALPVWGVCSCRLGESLHLVTFDSHTDTRPSFQNLIKRRTGKAVKPYELGLANPVIRKLLQGMRWQRDDFCFEDVYRLALSELRNDEQILAGVDLGYLASYTVITKEEGLGEIFEGNDRDMGYDATYISREDWRDFDLEAVADPLVVDFDLDFFGSAAEMDEEFVEKVTPLVRRAKAITIAREPRFFEDCRTDEAYTNDAALAQLVGVLKRILE